MKKGLSLLLVLMMVMGLMTFTAATAEEVPVITIATTDVTNVEDYNTNTMTLLLEEACGVDIQFIMFPATDYMTKINMMVATGGAELPDVIFGEPSSDAMLISWIESGVILPLTEYYNDPALSPNIHESFDRLGVDFRPMVTMYDGNIYGISSLNQTYNSEYSKKLWMNSGWMAQLGVEAPTTPDELYDLLVMVKETDLNGNGIQDEIGMVGNMESHTGWFSYMMNPFVYAGAGNYLTVNDGQVGLAYLTDEWKEGLKFIRKAFAEDLIPKEILTQDNNQFLAMLNSELCTTMMFFYSSPSQVNPANTWRDDFEGYAPMIGYTGRPLSAFGASVPNRGVFFITKNCENPEAAFRIGDMMISTTFSIITRWGEEGVDWDYVDKIQDIENYTAWVDGFDMLFTVYDDATFWSSGTMQNRSFMQKGPYIREYGIANGRAVSPDTITIFDKNTAAADNLYQKGNFRPDEYIPKLVYSADEIDVIADIQTTLSDFNKEWTANFLSGNIDIDAQWDAYQAELKNIGVDQYLEVIQGVYDRLYK